jgi:hypothetical protein
MFLDSILHHLWNYRLNTSWQSINELIELMHITPRTTWNSKVDKGHALKYISWTLNVNINLFTIREKKETFHNNKYILQYQFQNTLIKLLRQPKNFSSINIVTFKNKYFLLITPNIFPTLINIPPLTSITFNNVTINAEDVLNIIENSSQITFPFTIKVYSSYSFIKHNSKHLTTNMIGQYTNVNETDQETLFVFITPCLERNGFYLHQLPYVNPAPFIHIYPFKFSRHYEGEKLNLQSSNLPKITNQKVCICQHDETQEMTLPKKSTKLGRYGT